MQVTELGESRYPDYEAFLQTQDDALFYHSIGYLNLLKAVLGNAFARYLLATDDSGVIQGCLPIFAKQGPYGEVLNSLPFYGSNGGILASNLSSYDILLKAYNERVKSSKVCASTLVSNFASPSDRKLPAYDYIDTRISQVSPIGYQVDHRENLMASFHQKTRNMVRKAEKSGIEVRVDNLCIPFLRETHIENMKQLGGKAKSDVFFQSINDCFEANKSYRIYVATVDEEPVAALLLFYYKNYVEYYTPAVRQEFRGLQPMSLIILQAMEDASKQGFEFWNWGGTWLTQDGVHRFKSRFAARDLEYTYYIKLNFREVLRRSPGELIESYPDFFVVPFAELES